MAAVRSLTLETRGHSHGKLRSFPDSNKHRGKIHRLTSGDDALPHAVFRDRGVTRLGIWQNRSAFPPSRSLALSFFRFLSLFHSDLRLGFLIEFVSGAISETRAGRSEPKVQSSSCSLQLIPNLQDAAVFDAL